MHGSEQPSAFRRCLAALARATISLPGGSRLGAFVGRITPREGVLPAVLFGLPTTMDLSDEIQRGIYIGGYELEETAFVRRILGKGMTFVDVGANVGYYTALAAKLVGATGRVLSFEPCAAAFSKLQAMAGRCSHVQLFNLALGDAEGLKALYVPPFEEHNLNPSMYEYRTDMLPTTVPVATLDKVLDGIDRVDLLKVDVEGYEPSIFAGAGKSMRSGKVRYILYESNPRMLALGGGSDQGLYSQITEMGFREVACARHKGPNPESWYVNRLMTFAG